MADKTINSSRTTLGLFIFRILRALISIVTLILSAKYFGVSAERDAWLLASNCLNVLDMAIWGPINETFRTKFIFIKSEEGEAVTIHKTASLFIFTLFISAVLFTIILFYPSLATSVIAPGKSDKELEILVLILRILAPSLLLNQATLLLSNVLNAYNIFYIPEIAGFISTVLNIIFLIVLVPSIGIYSLVVSYYISLFLLLFLLIYQVRKNNIPLFKRPVVFDFQYVKPYILFALPFFFPYFFGQLNGVADQSIASLIGDGAVSIIDYSRKFINIPIGVLTSILTTVLVPILSQKYLQNDMVQFKNELKNSLQLGLFILGIILVFFIINSSDVVHLLYTSKKIASENLSVISSLTILYAMSGFAIYYYSTVGLALLSANKGKVYATCGVVAQLLMLLFNVLLFRTIGVFIFPISLFLSHLIAALVMTVNFPAMVKPILSSILVYVLFIALLSGIAYFSSTYIFSHLYYAPIIMVIIKTAFIFLLAIILVFIFKMDERQLLLQAVEKAKFFVFTNVNTKWKKRDY